MPYAKLFQIEKIAIPENASCDNPYAILTMDNDVIFLGNITVNDYASNEVLFTLPENMRPIETIVEPVYVNENLVPLKLTQNGDVSINGNIPNGTIYISGTKVNVSGAYYNDDIGNVDTSKFTSPLNWEG